MRIYLAALCATLFLSGCITTPEEDSGYETVELEKVLRQLKYDLGTYIYRHQDDEFAVAPPGPGASAAEIETFRQSIANDLLRAASEEERCLGQVSLQVSKITVSMATIVEDSAGTQASLKVPINVFTLTPSGKSAASTKQSITTSFTIYPGFQSGSDGDRERLQNTPQPINAFSGHPITDTLEALKKDMENTADTLPCFNFGVEEKQKNSVKLGFEIKQSTTIGGKLEFLVFSIGAEETSSNTVTNTIEVFFVGQGEFG